MHKFFCLEIVRTVSQNRIPVSTPFRFRKFMSDPVMKPKYNIPLSEERELALARLQRICDNGFISVLDFRDNPLRIFAAHELAAIIGRKCTSYYHTS